MAKFKTELKNLSVMGANRVMFFNKNGELETDCEVAIKACQNIAGVEEVKGKKDAKSK